MTDSESEVLGTTTITDRWRISLIKAVREEYADQGYDVTIGDRLVFRLEDDKVVVEPAGQPE